MNFLKAVIKRPATVILLMVSVMVFGVFGISNIRMEYFPDMDAPMHIVFAVYPGADAGSIEKNVSKPIEDIGKTLTGIKTINSYTFENYAIIQFTYNYGTDLDELYIELRAALDNISQDLPEECESPQIMEIGLNSQATISLAIKAEDGGNISDIAKYVNNDIVPALENINGVAKVEITGVNEDYVKIVLDENKLNSYSLSIANVVDAISAADFNMPIGSVKTGKQEIAAVIESDIVWHRDILDLGIQTPSGNIVTLNEVVSTIGVSEDKAEGLSRYNGQECVLVNVTKKSSGETLKVCDAVIKKINQLKIDGMEYEIAYSSADDIKEILEEVIKTLIEGIVFSMIVLLIFFGDLKASIIVGSSMPLSVFAAVFILSLIGMSFELMSGTGLIIAIGMLVDNSIVVLESCFRYKDEGANFKKAAMEGTNAVIFSVVASTITTVVVYIPLSLIGGMSGQVLISLSYAIVFTMISSLISAMTVVPTLFHLMKPRAKHDIPINRILAVVQKVYKKVLPVILKHPRKIIVIAIILLSSSVMLATTLNMDLFPSTYDGSISVVASFKSGTTVENMDAAIKDIEETLLQDENFDSVELNISGNEVEISAYSSKNNKRTGEESVAYYKEMFSEKTGMDVLIMAKGLRSGFGAFFSPGNEYQVMLVSEDYNQIEAASAQVAEVLKGIPGVYSVSNQFEEAENKIKYVIDQKKASYYGMTTSSIATQIYVMLNGIDAGKIKEDGEEYKVKVKCSEDKYKDAMDILDATLYSPNGDIFTVGDVASIEYGTSLQRITRQDGNYTSTISAFINSEKVYAIKKEGSKRLSEVDFPDKVRLASNSSETIVNEELVSISKSILIAIYLVFLVMAIQFNSPKYSIMVMTCIPFSMVGSFGLMYIFNQPLSMMSLMGLLMMLGMVVNNGILLVDTTNQLREIMPLHDALIQAGLVRLRPILMTTLTTILSMLPLVLSSNDGMAVMKGMGYVIIGGLITSTILALFLMPPFYLLMSGKRRTNKELEDELA